MNSLAKAQVALRALGKVWITCGEMGFWEKMGITIQPKGELWTC